MMNNIVKIYVKNTTAVRDLLPDFCSSRFPARYEKAQRFRFEADRLRSLAAGCLIYEHLTQDESKILTAEYGKPYIPGGPEFSLSHSGELALLSVGQYKNGVDVELISQKHLDIAKRVFTPEEQEWISADMPERFWILWTLKEAVSKAVGKGLSLNFGAFSVLGLALGGTLETEGLKLHGYTQTVNGYAVSCVTAGDEPVFELIYGV